MRSEGDPRLSMTLQLVLVALCSAAILGYVQQPAPGLYGFDGHYHIRYSELLRQDLTELRGFVRTFSWWQETFLRDHWADKDLLYHLLLIPFTLGDLDRGGKTASIFFGAALYVCFFLALRWVRAPAPALWSLVLLASSTVLLYRSGLVRSHVVAIPLSLLGTSAILRGHRAGILLTTAAYALTHIAWHLLPGVALIHDTVRSVIERRFRLEATLPAAAGTAAAIVFNPYFPNNLRLWWVQNLGVLTMAWSPAAPDLGLGNEMLPVGWSLLLYYNLGPALFTVAGILLLVFLVPRDESISTSLTCGVVTIGFLVLSCLSRRFVEFWAPFSAMFAAIAAGRCLERLVKLSRVIRVAAGGILAVSIVSLGAHNVAQARRIVGEDPGRIYDACSTWIRDHVPAGQTVFTSDWDEFSELFFTAPRQHYLVGLDPTFMYATNPDRWRLWRDIVDGRANGLHEPIAKIFRCRHLFADAAHEQFIERADQDPWLRCEARSPDCGVYSVRDDMEAAGTASAAGAARAVISAWRLDGGGVMQPAQGDFVDIDRLRGTEAPAGTDRDCAILQGVLDAPAAGEMMLSISTNDTFRVEVDGTERFDSRVAAGPSLDEVIEERRAGSLRPYERSFTMIVSAGEHDITISTCRAGHAWGFFLRITAVP